MQLSPNNKVIKDLIGHYASGHITTIYGNAASGKTTTCLMAAIQAAKQGKVIYVDTEGGFDAQRFSQLTKDTKLLDNIFLIQPKSFEEQHDTILKVKRLAKNPSITLVIVDTIGNLYRIARKREVEKSNKMLVSQLANLVRIARDLDKVVLMTNQVYAKMEESGIKMVGGSITYNLSRVLIELHKQDEKRMATLIKYKLEEENKHPNLGKKIAFEIEEKGFSPV